MKLRRRQAHKDPHINLVPLIDTLFLLLVFFMMTTTFNQKGMLNVDLPQVQGDPNSKVTEAQPIRVVISPQGEYAINDLQHALINNESETLKRALQQNVGSNPNPTILISADAKAPYQAVLKAMKVISDLGYSINYEYEQPTDSK
jgi:biopolymer transport protein ExbD